MPRVAIVATELVLRKNGIVLPITAALGVPNVAVILAKGGADGFHSLIARAILPVFFLNEGNT